MKRLGVAQVIQKASYTPKKVTRKLRKMLDDPEMAEKARAVAEQLCGEDGVKTACDALESTAGAEPVFAVNFDRPYDPYELSKPSLTLQIGIAKIFARMAVGVVESDCESLI